MLLEVVVERFGRLILLFSLGSSFSRRIWGFLSCQRGTLVFSLDFTMKVTRIHLLKLIRRTSVTAEYMLEEWASEQDGGCHPLFVKDLLAGRAFWAQHIIINPSFQIVNLQSNPRILTSRSHSLTNFPSNSINFPGLQAPRNISSSTLSLFFYATQSQICITKTKQSFNSNAKRYTPPTFAYSSFLLVLPGILQGFDIQMPFFTNATKNLSQINHLFKKSLLEQNCHRAYELQKVFQNQKNGGFLIVFQRMILKNEMWIWGWSLHRSKRNEMRQLKEKQTIKTEVLHSRHRCLCENIPNIFTLYNLLWEIFPAYRAD